MTVTAGAQRHTLLSAFLSFHWGNVLHEKEHTYDTWEGHGLKGNVRKIQLFPTCAMVTDVCYTIGIHLHVTIQTRCNIFCSGGGLLFTCLKLTTGKPK